MVQFYCLSVVMNIFAGLILVYGIDLTKKSSNKDLAVDSDLDSVNLEKKLQTSDQESVVDRGLGSRRIRFVIGILSVVVGFVKIFSTYGGIPVFGDLLPAVTGLAAGVSILLEFYMVTTTEEDFELKDNLKTVFIDYRKYLGVLCFLSAVLHFLLPKVIIF